MILQSLSVMGILSSAIAATAAQVGSKVLETPLNWLNQRRQVNQAKELWDYQTDYKHIYDKMREAGVNPGAALQGISGAAPSASMTLPSSVQTDFGNVGSVLNEDLTRPSVIASNQASAAASEAAAEESESRKLLNYQQMSWNPRRWSADIRKIQSEIGVNKANARYLGELATTVEQKRPWEIKTMKYGLTLARAQVSELMSRSRYNRAAALNQQNQADYWSYKADSESFDVFQHKWNASLVQGDWNPSQPLWQNLGRVAFTNPQRAVEFIDNGIDFLDRLDNKAKEKFGKHYKRNAAILIGTKYLNDRIGEHKTKRGRRINTNINSVMRLVPVVGSFGGSSVPSVFSGDDDWFDFYDR